VREKDQSLSHLRRKEKKKKVASQVTTEIVGRKRKATRGVLT